MVDLNTLGGWVVAVLVAIIGGIFALKPKKGDAEHRMIDQMQEQIQRLDAKIKETDATVAKLRIEIRIRDDYIFALRKQINDEEPPPPKPWPEGLL